VFGGSLADLAQVGAAATADIGQLNKNKGKTLKLSNKNKKLK
jgi:hypothetical protein